MQDKYTSLVWKILSGIPVEIYDEDYESVWANEVWELVEPRESGDYVGSHDIGSANITIAVNILKQALVVDQYNIDCFEAFKEILDTLAKEHYIRKKPSMVRKTFKVV